MDLEDRQAELITELYCLSQKLLTPLRDLHSVPEAWRASLRSADPSVAELSSTDGGAAGLGVIESGLRRLYRVNQALARLDGPDFGRCASCLAPIAFEALALDPTRLECNRCASD